SMADRRILIDHICYFGFLHEDGPSLVEVDRRYLRLSACRLYRISVRVSGGPPSLKQVPIVLAAARCRGEPPRTKHSVWFQLPPVGSNCHRLVPIATGR